MPPGLPIAPRAGPRTFDEAVDREVSALREYVDGLTICVTPPTTSRTGA